MSIGRRCLGIDWGTRRIGLALSDAGGSYASPLNVLSVTTPHEARFAVEQIVQTEGVQVLVVGLPLNMDGSLGPSALATVDWASALRGELELVFVDERLSSFEAEQTMITRKRAGEKITRAGKKKRLDAVAAAGVLQAFLDGKLQPIKLSPRAAG